jgi:deoxyadenosine/deoxycytidine kinase
MILFINGSFRVGKTTVAEMLVKRISNSLLFDPFDKKCRKERITWQRRIPTT